MTRELVNTDAKPQPDATSSQKAPTWENSNYPLYLHHYDQPGVILVAQPLMEDNFTQWIESMNMVLQIKNKIGFVNETLTKPAINLDEQVQWDRCNILVKTWLLASMSREIAKSFSHCKDARTVWLELYERFGQTNTVQLFHIENAIHDCVQGSSSVTSFFTKLKGLWDEKESLCAFPPCTCEAATAMKTYLETQKTMKFLMGLTEDFATVRSNVIGMDPLPSLDKTYSLALRHEKQVAVATGKVASSSESAAVFHVASQAVESTAAYMCKTEQRTNTEEKI